jgi:hypothetical protein
MVKALPFLLMPPPLLIVHVAPLGPYWNLPLARAGG